MLKIAASLLKIFCMLNKLNWNSIIKEFIYQTEILTNTSEDHRLKLQIFHIFNEGLTLLYKPQFFSNQAAAHF